MKNFVKLRKLYLKYYDPIQDISCGKMNSRYRTQLIERFGVEKIVNKKIFKYSIENYNNVLAQEDLPQCLRSATDLEIEATSPFKSGSSI